MKVCEGALAVVLLNAEESSFPKCARWHRWPLQDACQSLGIPSCLNLPASSVSHRGFEKLSIGVLLVVQLSEAAPPSLGRCHWASPMLVLMGPVLTIPSRCWRWRKPGLPLNRSFVFSAPPQGDTSSGHDIQKYTHGAHKLWCSLFLVWDHGLLYSKTNDSSDDTNTRFSSPNKYTSSTSLILSFSTLWCFFFVRWAFSFGTKIMFGYVYGDPIPHFVSRRAHLGTPSQVQAY